MLSDKCLNALQQFYTDRYSKPSTNLCGTAAEVADYKEIEYCDTKRYEVGSTSMCQSTFRWSLIHDRKPAAGEEGSSINDRIREVTATGYILKTSSQNHLTDASGQLRTLTPDDHRGLKLGYGYRPRVLLESSPRYNGRCQYQQHDAGGHYVLGGWFTEDYIGMCGRQWLGLAGRGEQCGVIVGSGDTCRQM